MVAQQRVDDLVERFALHDFVELVERQIDAVVGDAALREIIGADALRAVAGADLLASVRGRVGVEPLALGVIEAGAQERMAFARFYAASALPASHDDAGRQMRDADRRIRSC